MMRFIALHLIYFVSLSTILTWFQNLKEDLSVEDDFLDDFNRDFSNDTEQDQNAIDQATGKLNAVSKTKKALKKVSPDSKKLSFMDLMEARGP